MASARRRPEDRTREVVFWLGFAVFSIVVLILVGVIYALITARNIESAPPRTMAERQLRTVKAALVQNSANEELWGDYVFALVESGQYSVAERAIADADKALKGRKAEVTVEEARLAWRRGDLKAALKLADKALAQGKKERDAKVKEYEKKGVRQEPPPGARLEALLILGEIYEQQKDWDRLVKAYSEALELDPTMSDVLLARGEAYAELGNTKAAKADFEQALTFIPDWEPARAALAELER